MSTKLEVSFFMLSFMFYKRGIQISFLRMAFIYFREPGREYLSFDISALHPVFDVTLLCLLRKSCFLFWRERSSLSEGQWFKLNSHSSKTSNIFRFYNYANSEKLKCLQFLVFPSCFSLSYYYGFDRESYFFMSK